MDWGYGGMGYELILGDCFDWLEKRAPDSVHGVVTDPPYTVTEFSAKELRKMRAGKGGVWRIPPSFGGSQRRPVPRFSVLTGEQIEALREYFLEFARRLIRVVRPGGHLLIASTPLVSYVVAGAIVEAGFERRGEVIRLGTITMRGGDRPKNAEKEFPHVSVMPRGAYEPWLLFRRPLAERTVAENLRAWSTGALRRAAPDLPFFDVIQSGKTPEAERRMADHPSLKPQAFLRQVVWSILPLGTGVVLDPFAGSGSTLAAAEAIDYNSIGIERDAHFYQVARDAIPQLARCEVDIDPRHVLMQSAQQAHLETLPLFRKRG
jgi:site-specific DNA-methyltransferase (adenine-specific)